MACFFHDFFLRCAGSLEMSEWAYGLLTFYFWCISLTGITTLLTKRAFWEGTLFLFVSCFSNHPTSPPMAAGVHVF